jgi:hypothetical protein
MPDDFKALEANYRLRTGKETQTLSDIDLPDVDRPESTLGNVTASLLQWGIVFAATRRVTGFSGGVGFAANASIADFVAFDPLEDRASDIAVTLGEGNPVFDNALTQYLAHGEDDSNLESRLKNSIEGLVLGGVIAVGAKGVGAAAKQTFEMFKWLKGFRKAKAEAAADDAVRASVNGAEVLPTPLSRLGDDISEAASEKLSIASRAQSDTVLRSGRLSDDTIENVSNATRENIVSTSDEISPFHIIEDAEGISVKPKDPEVDAYLNLVRDDDGYSVAFPKVADDLQGQGIGTGMYEEAADLALKSGEVLKGGVRQTEAANRVWKKLVRMGYDIDVNPTLKKGDDGMWFTENGEPSYVLKGRPSGVGEVGSAGARQVVKTSVPVDTKLSAKSIMARVRGESVEAGIDGTPRSNLIDPDKIDWDSFGGSKSDMFDLVEKVTAFNKRILDAAGEKVSLKDIQAMAVRLARETGDDPVAIMKALTLTGSPADAAARQAALMNLLDSSAQRISDLSRSISSGLGFETRKQLHIQLARHNYLKALAKGNASEAARLMRQQRELVKAGKANDDVFREILRDLGQDADDPTLVRELSALISVEDITKAAASVIPGKTSSRVFAYWYAQLLSNPASWVANTLGPAWNLAFGSLVELPVQALVGAYRGSANRVTAGEIAANYFGAVTGAKMLLRFPLKHYFGSVKGLNRIKPKELAKYINDHEEQVGTLYRTVMTGEAQTRAATKFGINRLDASFEKFRPLPAEMFDELKLRQKVFHGMHYLADSFGLTGLGNFGLKALKVPGGVFALTDEIFNTVAYHQKYNQELFRIVNREVKDKIRDGSVQATRKSQKEYIDKRMVQLLERDPQTGKLVDRYARELSNNISKSADAHAAYVTFQSALGPKIQPLLSMTTNNPQLRIFVPFIRTPTNIYKQAFIERTPWPWIKALWNKQHRTLLQGGREADEMIAKAAMGSITMASAAAYWAAGNVTGSRTDGLNSEDFDNVRRYSIKFGDTWYQYNRLEPLGMLIGLTADIMEAGSRLQNEPKSEQNDQLYEQLIQLAGGTLMAGIENMFSKTYMQGMADMVGIMSGDEYAIDRVKGSLGFSLLIPGGAGLRAVGNATDPWAREAFDFWDKLQSQIPLVRESLPIQRDYFGLKVATPERAGPELGSPVMTSTESIDPLRIEMARLKFPITMPQKSVRNVPLTAEEYSRLLEIRGQFPFSGGSMEEYLSEYVHSPEYRHESLSDAGRIEALTTIVSRYGSAAREQLIKETPELQQRIRELKINQATALQNFDVQEDSTSAGISEQQQSVIEALQESMGIQQ